MTNQDTHQLLFSSMSLSPQITRAVKDMNYENATSIQAAAIPYILNGQDVIGHSNTGTGKTAAFGIPAVECVDSEVKRAQILVLSPTRELAMQIAREMRKYSKYKEGVAVAAVYGGAPMSEQIRQLRRANVIIGTPGRLMDHLRRKTLKMDGIKMVVLDEADEMLSMGFIEDIQTILAQAPAKRQTVLFSATMPPPILKISKDFLTDPQIVDVVAGQENQADIEQTYYYVPQRKKPEALTLLLQHANAKRSIVFCNTKSMVDELSALLRKQGVSATGLHGDMTQAVRTQVMQGFRTGLIGVLVATDVAARGIDVDDVDAVINFDLPQSFEYYVHRIGRTGRAGKQGISQTLVSNGKQVATLRSLMRFTGSDIKEHRLPTSSDMMERAVSQMAEKMQAQMQKESGKAAQMLVKRLLGTEGSGIDAQQIAYALAEKLLGGDKKYASIKELEVDFSSSRKQGSGANSGGRGASGVGRGASNSERAPMVTVTANIGRSSRITPNHLVGSIVELLNIPSNSIGKIDIRTESSSMGLREDVANALMNYDKPVRIKGLEVSFEMQPKKTRSRSVISSQIGGGKKPSAKNHRRQRTT